MLSLVNTWFPPRLFSVSAAPPFYVPACPTDYILILVSRGRVALQLVGNAFQLFHASYTTPNDPRSEAQVVKDCIEYKITRTAEDGTRSYVRIGGTPTYLFSDRNCRVFIYRTESDLSDTNLILVPAHEILFMRRVAVSESTMKVLWWAYYENSKYFTTSN